MLSTRSQQKIKTKLLPKLLFVFVAIGFLLVAFYRDVGLVSWRKNSKFYTDAEVFWAKQEPNELAMIGATNLSQFDITDSITFVNLLKSKYSMGSEHALDCGSGIGRVSKYVLLPHFETVDMVDVTQKFIEASTSYLGNELNAKIGQKYVDRIQSFSPQSQVYDLIWMQWVTGHLMDEDLVATLKRMKGGLKSTGLIVVKDNIGTKKTPYLDRNDSTLTRPKDLLLRLFTEAGLNVFEWRKQENWPKNFFQVHMFAMK